MSMHQSYDEDGVIGDGDDVAHHRATIDLAAPNESHRPLYDFDFADPSQADYFSSPPTSTSSSSNAHRSAKAAPTPLAKRGLASRLTLRNKQAATHRSAALQARRERATHPNNALGMIHHGHAEVAAEVAQFVAAWMAGSDVDNLPLRLLCDGLAANLDESQDGALVEFAESLLCQTNLVGMLSAMLEQQWESPLLPSRHESRVLALRCLANLRMLSHEYPACRSRINLHLSDAVAAHVMRTYELSGRGTENDARDLMHSIHALEHALQCAAQRCPGDLVEAMTRNHAWDVLVSVVSLVSATRLCCAVADPAVEGSDTVLRYLGFVLDQCPTPQLWANHPFDISSDIVEALEYAVFALEKYAMDARGLYQVQPYVKWNTLFTMAMHHPSRETGLVAMALLSRYEEEVAAAVVNTNLFDWCVEHVQRHSSRLVALNILRAIPRFTGTRLTQSHGLYSALCGVIRGPDRLGRLHCLKLLVALRNEGMVKQVLDFCEYNSSSLEALLVPPQEDSWPGSGTAPPLYHPSSRDLELDDEEMELAEALLQLVDVDPFS